MASKVKETVQLWSDCPFEIIACDFQYLIQTMDIELPNLPTFGYNSNLIQGGTKGVVCIIDSDHGGGSSKYLSHTNYLPSSTRRDNDRIDFGTLTIQFAKVKCQKDAHQVQAKIAPIINTAVKKLESSKLISIVMNNTEIICKFVPASVQDINIEVSSGTSYLCYRYDEQMTR